MRARAFLGIVAVLTLISGTALSATPAEARDMDNGQERGQFALAGWSSMDGGTGEEHFRMITVNASIRGPAEIYFDSWDAYPVECPDGEDGQRIVEGTGQGSGTFRVRSDLSAATLTGAVDVKTTTRIVCESAEGATFARARNVPVSFDLTGVGPRWRESGGTFQHIPGFVNSHSRSTAAGRDAAGAFTVGNGTYPLVFGDFGRVSGRWHYSRLAGSGAARMELLRAMGGLAQPPRTRTGAIVRAGAVWERTRGDRYRGILLDAEQPRGDEAVLYLQGYASRPTQCPDGSRSLLERIQYGESAGALVVRGHDAHAAAETTMDVVTDIVNGCTGETRSSVRHDLTATLALDGSGSVARNGEWSFIHNPGHGNDRVRVTWTGREAHGAIRLGSVEYSPTSWGAIGTYRWWEHLQSRDTLGRGGPATIPDQLPATEPPHLRTRSTP